jgi:hypothetical protein
MIAGVELHVRKDQRAWIITEGFPYAPANRVQSGASLSPMFWLEGDNRGEVRR